MAIKLLDCTLREGAYVVNYFLGSNTIKEIINSLSVAGIEIIEAGWLRNANFDMNKVMYSTPDDLKNFVSDKKTQFALMFDCGKYDINKLSNKNGLVDIIRIAFYKKRIDEVSFIAEKLKSSGYKIFLQPSNILEYSEFEMEKLCKRANYIGVDALYIVDSFGSMFPEDLNRVMPIFNQTVNKPINIGFHSHNSIQLSFALSMQFINYMDRDIVVDSSLCGMGRGAGNTKTELLAEFLNRRDMQYDVKQIWDCIYKNILPLCENYNWEYTPERAYKGIMGAHPVS